MAARTAAPWTGANGVRELPSRFNRQDSYGPTRPGLSAGAFLCLVSYQTGNHNDCPCERTRQRSSYGCADLRIPAGKQRDVLTT